MPERTYYFGDTSFNLLMQKRIRRILVICSQYDFFMLEEDGRIDELIFNEYVSLNLRYPPVFIHANSAKSAMKILLGGNIDLIIEMLSIGDMDTFRFARHIKKEYPAIPIVVLTNFSREVSLRLEKEDLSAIDHVFCWLGNTDLFLAIIKLIEDSMNAENDILKVGVQTILLIEDSVRYISVYLPNLYRIILQQSKEFVKEALNEHQQMLRRRGRPKILLAKSYQEAVSLYSKYKGHILGIISDVSYKSTPDHRDTKTKAGLKFCRMVKKEDPNMPFLLQSSDENNARYARELAAGFLDKYSKNLSNELREFILKNFGFGELVFRDPMTQEEKCIAVDLKSLQELILSLPDDVLEYHTRRDDFSKWLNARALFPIAQRFKEKQYDDFKSPNEVRKFIYQAISNFRVSKAKGIIAEFDQDRFDEYLFFSRIGEGSLGGKARGLAFISQVLKNSRLEDKYPDVLISVPPSVVLSTDVFDEFMETNSLYETAISSLSDDEILQRFISSKFPDKIRDDLRAIARIARRPIAVRSSSKLEDSYYQPFAGIYNTYMVPPNKDPVVAVAMLEQAIKCVYASVYFKESKAYMTATTNLIDEEKMGVIIQSVCGNVYGDVYYPTLSGVARSINYYPTGNEKPSDGVVNLAYGLGRQIVEGGENLRFSPKYPHKILQLSSPSLALKSTQKTFYALEMDIGKFRASADDRINLRKIPVKEAEEHASLRYVASTFDMENQIIRDGHSEDGKSIITFSPVLNHNMFPLAAIINDLLEISSNAMNAPVEIEFAANLDTGKNGPFNFNFLQVRPIVMSETGIITDTSKYSKTDLVAASDNALGNGIIEGIKDIVYIKIKDYSPSQNHQIAEELDRLNKQFVEEKRNYVLIGPGRWGSADPWLGIPVKWSQISQARLIIELGIENYKVEPSQGTHFFHNLTSFGVGYFTINPQINDGYLDMDYLDKQQEYVEYKHIRSVRFEKAICIEIDGRSTKGVICKA